jgi:hypothetical protein
MKRTTIILALLAAIALAASSAQAGWLKRVKLQKSAPVTSKTWRYDRLPTVDFHKGELRSIGLDRWQLGTVKVELAPGCQISGGRSLRTGSTAIVMGPRLGDTIVAWRVELRSSQQFRSLRRADTQIERSEADPTVGVGTGPN